jgi:N-acetylglucosamine-6-sulfatase
MNDQFTLSTWLQTTGYATALIGKYLNEYPFKNRNENYIPPGWDRWVVFSRTPGYYDYILNIDGVDVRYGSSPEHYSTDVLGKEANEFVLTTRQPFFLVFAPHAPHEPFIPAPRHVGYYNDIEISDNPNVNESDVTDKPSYVRKLVHLDEGDIQELYLQQKRADETLLSVDEAIRSFIETLEDRGILDNTVIVFMTDNGYSFGNHRWVGKICEYEECIRTPLMIRYPGAAYSTVTTLVENTDIAPTLTEIAGAMMTTAGDGRSLLPLLVGAAPADWRTSILIEFRDPTGSSPVTPFWGVRTDAWKYIELDTGEKELYDLEDDPNELKNLAGDWWHLKTRLRLSGELQRLRR